MDMNPTQRFSSRVDDYVRYRPGYPAAVREWLQSTAGLTPAWDVADIGSGTGNLSRLFLEAGNAVTGIEPNREMREAGERLLASYPRFASVDGSAENTTLQSASVDLVIAGQAFHWFDRDKAKQEFFRILRPNGWIALVWNERLADGSPFLREYESLLRRHATDYEKVGHRFTSNQVLREFFTPATMLKATFPNFQTFDWEGLLGRAMSSSYVPQLGTPGHTEFVEALEGLYRLHGEHGVVFQYETNVYAARIAP